MTLMLTLEPEVQSALILKALDSGRSVQEIVEGIVSRVLLDEA